MKDLLSDLNPPQRMAVENPEGPLLVAAGPGTGKTRTLTRRIAYLIQDKGVNPESILAITFTHRAANEMKERLKALVGKDTASKSFIGTFHGLGFEIIKQSAQVLGLKSTPIIYDEEDRAALLREVLKELAPDMGRYPVEKIYGAMEGLLNRGKEVGGVVEGFDLHRVYGRYAGKKKEEGAIDFNDLILLPIKLFRDFPNKLLGFQERWRHLFIDEYQDVNLHQVEMVRLLGRSAHSIMAIGDPDQAIYSFRGADVRNFLDFPKIFQGTRVLQLENNYRSSVTILDASDQVIRSNKNRLEGVAQVKSVGEKGLRVDLRVLDTERAEAGFVGQRIAKLTGGLDMESAGQSEEEFGFGEIAILYRLNTQARELKAALDRVGVPWRQVGKKEKALDLHERLVLACSRMSLNPSCKASWRMLEILRGRLKRSKEKLAPGPVEKNDQDTIFHTAARILVKSMPKEADLLMNSARSLADRVNELKVSVTEFLSKAPLFVGEDPFELKCQKVTLSTLHGAKGLEFPVVFITGLESGLIPFIRKEEPNPEMAMEEERRLLYVGMTRAQKRLLLLRSKTRMLFGERLPGTASPFLEDLSPDLINFIRKKRKPKKDQGQMRLF